MLFIPEASLPHGSHESGYANDSLTSHIIKLYLDFSRCPQAFLWEQLRNSFTKVDMIGNGAIFASVTKEDMQGIDLLCPPRPIIMAATNSSDPIHSEIATLSQQIKNLRSTRDIILPRLLSGQIDVEALDHA